MNTSTDQCYLMQLQIDDYLDGELEADQRRVFRAHVHGCAECAAELRFAQTMHDTVMDLPQLDCDKAVMAPVQRLARSMEPREAPSAGWLSFLAAVPRPLFFAVPATAALLFVVALWPTLFGPAEPALAPQVAVQPAPEDYSPEQVIQALAELNTAINYMNEVSQRTETMIGDRFLLRPLRESLNASFETLSDGDDQELNNGPI